MNEKLAGRRLIIAHNPASSRAQKVRERVLERLTRAGIAYEIFEIRQASLSENVQALAARIRPNDLILSAAGDGSAHAIAHSVLAAGQPGVQLGFLAFGNFNDLAHTFNSHATLRDPVKFLERARVESLIPLEIRINDAPLRNALLYTTIGWTARAAARFDNPAIRRRLQTGEIGIVRNMAQLGMYYLHSRQQFLADFGAGRPISDILCINGPVMARLFRTNKRLYKTPKFLVRRLDVSTLLPNMPFLLRSVFGKLPGERTTDLTLNFSAPSTIPLQCDGEVLELDNVKKLEVRKATTRLAILTTRR